MSTISLATYNPPKLTDGARACMAAMGLQTATDDELVYLIICKHTKPSNFCSYISWLVFQIKEAVKSLFGKSFKQTAISIIAKRPLDLAKEKKLLPLQIDSINQKTEVSLKLISKRAATDLFNFAVAFNQDPSKNTKELPQILKGLTPANILSEHVKALETAAQKAKAISNSSASTLSSAT